jgi:hypothetical protein
VLHLLFRRPLPLCLLLPLLFLPLFLGQWHTAPTLADWADIFFAGKLPWAGQHGPTPLTLVLDRWLYNTSSPALWAEDLLAPLFAGCLVGRRALMAEKLNNGASP